MRVRVICKPGIQVALGASHFTIRNFIQLAYNWRFRHYIRAGFICIMLTRLMWLVGTLMWLVGILDVACGTLK